MIRVVRPNAEPAELTANRDRYLDELARLIASGGTPDPEEIKGYDVARDDLFEAQYHKCCYCERSPLKPYQAVEHHRPKSVYWWLSWTWTNLLFVCQVCNRCKWDQFPLLSGVQLPSRQTPPGRERPAILDPADPSPAADPLAHIVFRKEPRGWVPYPREGSHRGRWTIHHCGLDRTDLLDLYQTHERQMQDAIKRIQQAIVGKSSTEIRTAWADVTERWLSPSMPLTALSRDILDHYVPPAVRRKYGLSLDLTPPWTA